MCHHGNQLKHIHRGKKTPGCVTLIKATTKSKSHVPRQHFPISACVYEQVSPRIFRTVLIPKQIQTLHMCRTRKEAERDRKSKLHDSARCRRVPSSGSSVDDGYGPERAKVEEGTSQGRASGPGGGKKNWLQHWMQLMGLGRVLIFLDMLFDLLGGFGRRSLCHGLSLPSSSSKAHPDNGKGPAHRNGSSLNPHCARCFLDVLNFFNFRSC